MRLRSFTLTALVLLAGTAAGCGSSDDSSGSTGKATKLTADAQAALEATVTKHLKRPDTIGISQPVKSVPKGKTLFYVYSNTPVAADTAKSAKKAAAALGWTFKSTAVKATPEGFQKGFDDALRDKDTDAIISTAVPSQVIATRVKAAAKRDIPVAVLSADRQSGDNFLAIGGPTAYEGNGQLQADYILSQSKGEANVLIAVPGALPTLNLTKKAFLAEWKAKCPACKTPAVYDAPVTSLGTTFPGLLTAYLQAHRNIDWVVLGFNDMVIGVPGALKAAGLNNIRATTLAQGAQSNPQLGKGFLEAEVGVPVIEYPWVAVDAVIRYLNKESLAPNQAFLSTADDPTHWIITKDGMEAAGLNPAESWPLNPNYADEFKKLWGLTK